jgi:hypothetical protein
MEARQGFNSPGSSFAPDERLHFLTAGCNCSRMAALESRDSLVQMKIRLTVIASALLLAASGMPGSLTAQQSATLADNASPRIPGSDFKPGFDDLMTLLIQPRHIRLYYAGTGNNWELAAFELAELRSAFRRTAQAMPIYQGNDVNAALQTFIDPKIQAIDAAIKSGNAKQFVQEYAGLTATCNACHTFLEHPFLVIKVPDAASRSAYADQNLGK